ncbi:hypothetical protein Baya_6239 [Bagarius yarrelli]|uniref:Uncharacterized protein n=1 Tax=Bagarius yarrelli TaxID=175774 RepID=A0A556U006_BAGYA|nr:hypothetical protein Baya_6239 [Bagarius yarrelli]
MADFASVFENQSNTATEQELDAGGQSKEDTDDSVFYREDEEIPQQILDPVWAPRSGEPIWPEKLHSAPQIHISESQAACHGTELKDANFELDSVAVLQGMKRKMDKKLNESPTDTDVHNETAANSRKITHTEELSASPVEPLRASNPAEAAQMKERG